MLGRWGERNEVEVICQAAGSDRGGVVFDASNAAMARVLGLLIVDTFFFSSRRRHTRCLSDWSSDVCSSDLSIRRYLRSAEERRIEVRTMLCHLTSHTTATPLERAQKLLAVSAQSAVTPIPCQIGRASCRERG